MAGVDAQRSSTRGTRVAVLAAGVLCCLLAGLVTAGPAVAHATLVSTDPGQGARLEAPPGRVSLTFSESVSLGAGYARVLDSGGQRVDTGTASVDGGVLAVPLRTDLPDGGYLVTYRVVSADSHPVSGAFSFVVGEGALVPAGAAGEDRGDPLVSTALPAARLLVFAGLALAIGVPALALLCWPAGWGSPRLRRLAAAGTAAVAVGSGLTFLLQGPYAAATGLGTVLDPDLLAATARSGAGAALLVRAGLALALAAVLLPVWRSGAPPSTGRLPVAGLLAAGLVLSTAATGHPVAGSWPGLAVAVAAVHVAAMAVWLGGLAGLLAGPLARSADGPDPATVLPGWSRLAFGAVAALVVSGAVQTVREVGSPTALLVTPYGRVLLVKLLLVAVLLGAAGVSRAWVHQRLGVRRRRGSPRTVTAHAFAAAGSGAPPAECTPAAAPVPARAEEAARQLPSLRRSVLVEVAVAVAVLALSAVLVGTPPARSVVSQPVEVVLPLVGSAGSSGEIEVSVAPARPGANTLHVYVYDDAGRLTQPAAIEVDLTEPAQGLGPIDVDLAPGGPGHYVGEAMAIPVAGSWTLTVRIRIDEFTATTASTVIPVR